MPISTGIGDWFWQKTKKFVIKQIKEEIQMAGQNIKQGASELKQALYNSVRDELIVPVADSGRAALGYDPTGTIPYFEEAPVVPEAEAERAIANMRNSMMRMRNMWSSDPVTSAIAFTEETSQPTQRGGRWGDRSRAEGDNEFKWDEDFTAMDEVAAQQGAEIEMLPFSYQSHKNVVLLDEEEVELQMTIQDLREQTGYTMNRHEFTDDMLEEITGEEYRRDMASFEMEEFDAIYEDIEEDMFRYGETWYEREGGMWRKVDLAARQEARKVDLATKEEARADAVLDDAMETRMIEMQELRPTWWGGTLWGRPVSQS